MATKPKVLTRSKSILIRVSDAEYAKLELAATRLSTAFAVVTVPRFVLIAALEAADKAKPAK
jgi:hypothetical protein